MIETGVLNWSSPTPAPPALFSSFALHPSLPSFSPLHRVIVWLRDVRLFPSRRGAETGPRLSYVGLFDRSLYERRPPLPPPKKKKKHVSSIIRGSEGFKYTQQLFSQWSVSDASSFSSMFSYVLIKAGFLSTRYRWTGEVWPGRGPRAGPSA